MVMCMFRDYVEVESKKEHATVSFNTFRHAWLTAPYKVRTLLCVYALSVHDHIQHLTCGAPD